MTETGDLLNIKSKVFQKLKLLALLASVSHKTPRTCSFTTSLPSRKYHLLLQDRGDDLRPLPAFSWACRDLGISSVLKPLCQAAGARCCIWTHSYDPQKMQHFKIRFKISINPPSLGIFLKGGCSNFKTQAEKPYSGSHPILLPPNPCLKLYKAEKPTCLFSTKNKSKLYK